MFRTSTQGQTGSYANHPGFGYQAAGFAGFPLVTGQTDGLPLPIPLAYTDFIAFEFGASALIAALIQRKRKGKGVCLDLSQIEASLHFLSPVIMDSVINSRDPVRMGNSSLQSVPHGVYRCQGDDQWCAIAVSNDEEWDTFTKTIGNPTWAAESRFSTFVERKRNEDALNALIEKWTVNQVAQDVMHLLQSAGVPCGVVLDGEGLLNDPNFKSRGYYNELDHPEMGPTLTAGQPFKMSATPHQLKMPSPCLGEHTELVCKEMLKMSDEEFVELFSSDCFK